MVRCMVAAGAIALCAAGCSSVDLGTPPADVNACRPGQQFFVDEIWPNVIDKSYNGKKCSDSGCHGPATTTRLRFVPVPPPQAPPLPPVPVPLVGEWAANYIFASESMQCTNAMGSGLYLKPTNQVVHSGGKLFERDSLEAAAILMWVTQP